MILIVTFVQLPVFDLNTWLGHLLLRILHVCTVYAHIVYLSIHLRTVLPYIYFKLLHWRSSLTVFCYTVQLCIDIMTITVNWIEMKRLTKSLNALFLLPWCVLGKTLRWGCTAPSALDWKNVWKEKLNKTPTSTRGLIPLNFQNSTVIMQSTNSKLFIQMLFI